ncbi:HAD family hydrolase [Flagellimonas flava]|uniref:HAD family hydrolase n=1 Tax=Flagellimonas flava TaxID=570519 RepID=UPI003D64F48F
MVKGVIFDFNGTLFFDTHLHNQAWDIFLDKHSLKLSDKEKDQKIHGKNNQEILTHLFSKELTLDDIKKLSVEKEDIYQTLCLKSELQLAPGAVNFIAYLADKGIPYTIATASDLYNLEFYFEYLNLAKYFDFSQIVYSDGTVKSKPNPEIFIKAMQTIGVHPNSTLIFEDSSSGITAAENSKAEKIVIVNSVNGDYSHWNHPIISDFTELDQNILEI